MIFIICAMKCEASPIISMLGLKQSAEKKGCYTGVGFCLAVTGVGSQKVRNAFADLPFCVNEKEDVFINIGVCGCTDEAYPRGSVFLIDEIRDENGSIPYYPDLLVNSDIPNAGCTTYSKVKTDKDCPTLLADMEAYDFYSGCLGYVSSDRIHLLKIVSDHMILSGLTKNDISRYVHEARSMLYEYIQAIRRYPAKTSLPDFSKYFEDYRFTSSVITELQKLNMYYYYKNNRYPDAGIYGGFAAPGGKKESMRIYDEIKKRLI